MTKARGAAVALAVLLASCSSVQDESRGAGTSKEEARALDHRVLEDCQALVEKLGPGWTLADHPKGALLHASKHGALTWDSTGHCVEIGCRDSKKIAVFVTDEDSGHLGAKIVDLTGRDDAALEALKGEDGWTGTIHTFNSDVAGKCYEQRLYLYFLVGEVGGEREVLTEAWCQAWRPCRRSTARHLE